MDKHILALAKLRALAFGASFATFGEAAVSAAAAFGEAAESVLGSEFTMHADTHACMPKGRYINKICQIGLHNMRDHVSSRREISIATNIG